MNGNASTEDVKDLTFIKKQTIFFSQPFHGREEKCIMEEREMLQRYMLTNHYVMATILDQYHQTPVVNNPTAILANDIDMMGRADWIVFHPSWYRSQGCIIEMMVCQKFKKDLHYFVLPDDCFPC